MLLFRETYSRLDRDGGLETLAERKALIPGSKTSIQEIN